ncbi:hypothetical protein HJG60_011005 [Phyllostomus discolor]|uniref:Uncharacterized protein n=1 Tax=Phyllostomus discolor TaxID=89673 RepID=A0A834ECY3_9CHIR|nr:hypothetical protein HJG60_011005 [Phyllostomus discolor]
MRKTVRIWMSQSPQGPWASRFLCLSLKCRIFTRYSLPNPISSTKAGCGIQHFSRRSTAIGALPCNVSEKRHVYSIHICWSSGWVFRNIMNTSAAPQFGAPVLHWGSVEVDTQGRLASWWGSDLVGAPPDRPFACRTQHSAATESVPAFPNLDGPPKEPQTAW